VSQASAYSAITGIKGYSAPQGINTPGGNVGEGAEGVGIGGTGIGAPTGRGDDLGNEGSAEGGGGDGGTVICTELHRQGLMPDEIYEADVRFGKTLPDEIKAGYYVWAEPLAALMSRSQIVTTIVKYPALKWAENMAGKPNWFGAFALKVGIPLCRGISRMLCLIQRQKLSTNQLSRSGDLS
jgi:hypothetical protein